MNSREPDAVERFGLGVDGRLDGSPLVLMLDVDGTIAPIAPTPAVAGVPSHTKTVIRRLVALPGVTVALVSGRAAADAWRLAGVEGAWVIGNHGIEIRTPDGVVSAKSEVLEFETVIDRATEALRPLEASVRGALIENKQWTLSVHYRLVTDDAIAGVVARAEEVAHALGLRVTRGKKIIELRPPIPVNKGTASVEFAEQWGALSSDGSTMYAGDDRTDEDAFRELRTRQPRCVTVRVVGSDDETVITTSAEFLLGSTEDLRGVLEWLVARRANSSPRAAAR